MLNLAVANDFVTRILIGTTTVESNNIYALKISDRNTVQNDETPEAKILLVGGVHPREWISPETVLRMAEYVIENYSTDDWVQFLIDNSEIYLIPVLNVDAFKYTQDNNNRFRRGHRDGRMEWGNPYLTAGILYFGN